MIPKSLGWLGKQVRSADGRPGSITNEFVGFGFVTLTLTPENGVDEVVTLLPDGSSRGVPAGSGCAKTLRAGRAGSPSATSTDSPRHDA